MNKTSEFLYVTYCRKSSDSEDRQVLSIDSQKKEMGDIALRDKLTVLELLAESKSAYKEGREEFGRLLELIRSGKANCILTYHLTRLARNSLDGGQIIYMMDQGLIKGIRTPEKLYTNTTDDKFMMQIHFAMAKKSSDDTSDFVKRDIQAKLRKGEYPDFAPIGYLNIDREGKISGKQYSFEKQEALQKLGRRLKRIEPDPFISEILKKTCELHATGQYSMNALRRASFDLGLTATRSKKMVSGATIERILKNPFYYGAIRWKGEIIEPEDLPAENRHDPIISREVFVQNQKILKNNSHPVSTITFYPYSNFMSCGDCGGTISGMMAKGHRYYRCMKCVGKSYIREEKVEEQVLVEVGRLAIDEDFMRLAIEELNKANEEEVGVSTKIDEQQERKIKECEIKLDNLVTLKISPDNTDGLLLDNEEFLRRKKGIVDERNQLLKRRVELKQERLNWYDKCVAYFDFACELRNKYPNLSLEKKREVFQFLYYNPALKDKLVVNSAEKQYQFLIDLKEEVAATITVKNGSTKNKTAYADAVRSVVRAGRGSNPQLLP